MRRLIGEMPTILRYMDAVLRQEREVLCLFACKSKHFLSIKPTFLATKSSRISNLVFRGRKLAGFLSLLPYVSPPSPLFLSACPLSFALCPSLRSRSVRPLHSLAPLAHACRHIRAYSRARALRTQRLSVFLPSPLPSIRLTFCDLWVKALPFPTSLPMKLDHIRHLHA